MICFKDKTFCSAFRANCSNHQCHRAFTASEKHAADLWWAGMSGEPPIAMSDLSENCPAIIPTK